MSSTSELVASGLIIPYDMIDFLHRFFLPEKLIFYCSATYYPQVSFCRCFQLIWKNIIRRLPLYQRKWSGKSCLSFLFPKFLYLKKHYTIDCYANFRPHVLVCIMYLKSNSMKSSICLNLINTSVQKIWTCRHDWIYILDFIVFDYVGSDIIISSYYSTINIMNGVL